MKKKGNGKSWTKVFGNRKKINRDNNIRGRKLGNQNEERENKAFDGRQRRISFSLGKEIKSRFVFIWLFGTILMIKLLIATLTTNQ